MEVWEEGMGYEEDEEYEKKEKERSSGMRRTGRIGEKGKGRELR
jgi:hypothetical protein